MYLKQSYMYQYQKYSRCKTHYIALYHKAKETIYIATIVDYRSMPLPLQPYHATVVCPLHLGLGKTP